MDTTETQEFKSLFDPLPLIDKVTYIVEELDQCIDYTDSGPKMEFPFEKFIGYFYGVGSLKSWLRMRGQFLTGKHDGDCINYPMSCSSCIYGDYMNQANTMIPKLIINDRESLYGYICYRVLAYDEKEYVEEFKSKGLDEVCQKFCEEYELYFRGLLEKSNIDLLWYFPKR